MMLSDAACDPRRLSTAYRPEPVAPGWRLDLLPSPPQPPKLSEIDAGEWEREWAGESQREESSGVIIMGVSGGEKCGEAVAEANITSSQSSRSQAESSSYRVNVRSLDVNVSAHRYAYSSCV
jgi:hypothetical protein